LVLGCIGADNFFSAEMVNGAPTGKSQRWPGNPCAGFDAWEVAVGIFKLSIF
jgi:hypothetical protein